jgi:hypothetical protein
MKKNKEVILMKFNVVKVLSIVGTVASIAGSLISGWAADRKMKETIAEMVKEELSKN